MRPPTPSISSTAPTSSRATTSEGPAKSAGRSRLLTGPIIGPDSAPATEPPSALDIGFTQEAAALVGPQAGVQAVHCQQPTVVAFFHDAALVHHDQAVHGRDGRQPVRDRDHGLAL